MKQYPKISIIMGVYNDSDFLENSIESMLSQSFRDFEFIICNDGSCDEKVNVILNRYENKDPRIKVIQKKKNAGLAAALNTCIEYSSGDFIARMDSDDISLPNRLEAEYEFLIKNENIAAVGTLAYYIDDKGIRYKKSKFSEKTVFGFDDCVKMTCIMHPTTMIRKNVIMMVDKYTVSNLTTRAEDYDLWCKITEKQFDIAVLNEYLFEYREDMMGFNKRKYKYRIQEFKIKKYWLTKSHLGLFKFYYAIRPLVVGLIPRKLMKVLKRGS